MPSREETKHAVKLLSGKMDEAFKRAEAEIYSLGYYAGDIVKKSSKYKDKSKHINQINGQLNSMVKVLKNIANSYKDEGAR